MIDIIHTILSIDPSAQVVVREGMDIEWHDGNPNGITAEQITAKQTALVIQADADAAAKVDRLVSVKEKLEALGLTTEEVKDAFGL
jgi:hypothetical protein|tara:strand:- start:557 stop:814 length:258 start_codon:yes stop_codon:yes gene_type:complete